MPASSKPREISCLHKIAYLLLPSTRGLKLVSKPLGNLVQPMSWCQLELGSNLDGKMLLGFCRYRGLCGKMGPDWLAAGKDRQPMVCSFHRLGPLTRLDWSDALKKLCTVISRRTGREAARPWTRGKKVNIPTTAGNNWRSGRPRHQSETRGRPPLDLKDSQDAFSACHTNWGGT